MSRTGGGKYKSVFINFKSEFMGEFDIRDNNALKESDKEFERALRPLSFGDFQGQKRLWKIWKFLSGRQKCGENHWTM